MADLHILCRMCTVEGGTPGGRCLRSGHKNSVKGKGAIKHKGAPTIIYHCTDAPFRLAPLATHSLSGGGKKNMEAPFRLALLATHPLSGGGQEKDGGKEELTQTLVSPLSCKTDSWFTIFIIHMQRRYIHDFRQQYTPATEHPHREAL